jgi:hypothetical protein
MPKGLLLMVAGTIFMLVGANQAASFSSGAGAAFVAIGVAFIAMGAKKLRSGGQDAR